MASYFRKQSGRLFYRYFLTRGVSGQQPGFLLNGEQLNKIACRQFHRSLQLDKIVSFNLSDIGEGIREVTVKEWFVKVGDVVEQFDNICEVQSDKASVTITSRYEGKVVKLYHKIDEIALVGKPLCDFDVIADAENTSSDSSDSSGDEASVVMTKSTGSGSKGECSSGKGKVLTTPAVRRIAMENNVDLSKVKPSGKFGRLLKGDLLEHLNLIPKGTVKPHPTLLKSPEPPKFTPISIPIQPIKPGEIRVEALKGVRKAMFKSMTEALKIPHFAYSDEINMSALMQLREVLKKDALERGVKLTYMPFFIKAASQALSKFPILNSSVDFESESIVYKPYHNISVAMDTPQGLVVPNVKNCEQKSIIQIAKDMVELMERGKKNALRPDDFAEGTFSLSNIGIVGGTYTHPCIMSPQVAIGAMGRTKLVPRFDDQGNIIKAYVMSVSWSADHRVIDGVTMASFSNMWKKYLENPNLFLLD